jgi:hypothetical protein
MKKLELEKALKDSILLEKKIKDLEKTLDAHKKLKKESDKEFLINAKNFFKKRAYPYKAYNCFRGNYIDHHVIIGGFLYTFYGVESQKIVLESGDLGYLSQKNKRHWINLSLDEFLEKTDPVIKSIREKDSFKKEDDVFINDSKLFMGYKDSGKPFMINNKRTCRGKILRILENNTAVVLLKFPGWGGPNRLELLVDLKQLRHTTPIDDIYNRIKENNFKISEMNGFKIGDQICYKNNKTPKYKDSFPGTFKILGFINNKVIVGAYSYFDEESYRQLFIINDIEEIIRKNKIKISAK